MNYLPRNRNRRLSRAALVACAVFAAGALFFGLLGGPLLSLVSPVWRGENALSRFFGRIGEYVSTRHALMEENLSLRDEVASLRLQVASLNLNLSREEAFASLLGREEKAGGIAAAVLTRPPQSPYDLFVIDAGSAEGVRLGALVRLPEGPVLGEVADVFSHAAKVRLFSTAGEKREAVLERGNIPVTLEGRGGGGFRIVVPRETWVEVGDRIVSADVSYSLLGVVEAVEVAATDAFKNVLVRGPANIFSVRFVSVVP